MLLSGPNSHLNDSCNQVDVSTDQLGLNAEDNPSAGLPEVVGGADETEAPAVGDLALSCTWCAQILEYDMSHQVQELKENEQASANVESSVRDPGWLLIARPQVEEHSSEAKQTKVVETVLKHIGERHSLT